LTQIIATAIALGICLHAGNHLACDFPRLIASGPDEYRPVARFFGRDRPTYRGLLAGAEGVTGIVMVTLMAVSFTLATRPFRKREETMAKRGGGRPRPFPLGHLAGFNAFWYSHHLLIVVYLLLLVHGWFMFLVDRWYQRTVSFASLWFWTSGWWPVQVGSDLDRICLALSQQCACQLANQLLSHQPYWVNG